MGLKVEKTYMKKKKGDRKSSNKKAEDAADNKDPHENEGNFSLVCMYDVEKLSCDAVALSGEDIQISPLSTSDADIIVPEDSKATLSFDDILNGIVKCNKRNIPVQLQTTKELLIEQDDSRLD